nr:IS3 family transposase [Thiothrix nivea]
MKTAKTDKKPYTRHSASYKAEALKLAERLGVPEAARQLGLREPQLYQWRSQQQHQQTVSQREQELSTENARLRRELAVAQEEVSIPKKSQRVLCETAQVKYAFIREHRTQFRLKTLCHLLAVSRSGYYEWLVQVERKQRRQQQKAEFDQEVARLFTKHKSRSGARRLQRILVKQGHACNRKTVAASLRRQGLVAKAARKFKATTNSNHNLPVFDNLLGQDFTATAPNQKWVGDITYLGTDEGWPYLAVVIDLFSRQVIGWAMGERMAADLVCDALQMAIFKRKRPKGVVVHSDRGSQYCSHAYRDLLQKYQLLGSMSAKGNCYDNACAESFFHSLKVEAIQGERFATREHMKQTVFEYIETDYNRNRLHSTLGYLSPVDFEAKALTS